MKSRLTSEDYDILERLLSFTRLHLEFDPERLEKLENCDLIRRQGLFVSITDEGRILFFERKFQTHFDVVESILANPQARRTHLQRVVMQQFEHRPVFQNNVMDG